MTSNKHVVSAHEQRELYRVALKQELQVGLAKRDGIDLRDGAARATEAFVVFEDEHVAPLWEELSANAVSAAHLFIAPVDFASGGLTMVTITSASTEFGQADYLVTEPHTFASLIEMLGQPSGDQIRVAVASAPHNLTAGGFTFCCAFAAPVNV